MEQQGRPAIKVCPVYLPPPREESSPVDPATRFTVY